MFNKKFRYCVYFFTWILPDYVADDIQKELKKKHFENMTAGFLQRCQNSLRQITPEMMYFHALKKLIFTNIAFK